MESTEEQLIGRSGICNNYYGQVIKVIKVINVINLKLTKEDVAVLGSGNQIGETISNILFKKKEE